MADNTIKVRLQSAYKSSADWDTLNPVLKNGEVGYVSSPASMYGWYKIGNGTSTWKQLPYSTYRPLNNGDFDTINVTDENVGNLIVTGAARFTNTIQGTATSAVNAGTASSASNAAKTTGTLTIKEALGSPGNVTTTFNGSANVTATITVPSHTSHLTNNSGYITSGATVAEAKKTSGTLTITQNGTSKGTFNGSANTTVALTDTVYTHPIDGKAGTFGSSTNQTPAFGGNAIVPWFTTNSAGHVTSAGTANLKIPSTSGLATTSYVNERVANAVHFKGGFAASNADALKTPVKEIGDMYVATAAGTFCSFPLEVGDSIIFSSSVAAGTNPSTTGSDFIGVEKTVSVTNSGPTLAWNTASTVGTVEGVALTVKMPANPNTNTTYTVDNTTSGVTSAYVGLHANGATTWSSTTNLATSAFVNPLINALTEGSSQASTADYIITSYVAAGTPTTTYHRRKASLVTVGKAEYATSAGAAPQDGHTYLTSANFTSSAGAAAVALKIVTSGTSAATASCSVPAFTASLAGIVKPPTSTANTKFLRSDNTWATVATANTTYSASASDKIALGGTNSTVFYHTTAFSASGSMTAGTAGTADAWGESIFFTVPEFNYDKWGHIISTSSKAFKVAIPSNPNSDTKVTQTPSTVKTYLLGTQSSTILSGAATTTSRASTAVYVTGGDMVMSGKLTVGGNDADTAGVRMQYNSTTKSLDFVFA